MAAMASIVLNLKPFVELSDGQFYELCQNHRDLKFERTAQGELVIVAPVRGEGGSREADFFLLSPVEISTVCVASASGEVTLCVATLSMCTITP